MKTFKVTFGHIKDPDCVIMELNSKDVESLIAELKDGWEIENITKIEQIA